MAPAKRSTLTRLRAPALLGLLGILAMTGLASAAVTVYTNDFSSRGEYRELQRAGGKKCEQRHRKKGKSILVAVKRGPNDCSFRPPVQGDGPQPDHEVSVEGKILDKTEGSARGGAYIEVSVRDRGDGGGYSLRVFPEKRRFELLRGPNGGEFPVTGRSDAIAKLGKPNELELRTSGSDVRASVNGEELARVDDADPGEVDGRRIRFGIGSGKRSGKDVAGTLKRVAVAVP